MQIGRNLLSLVAVLALAACPSPPKPDRQDMAGGGDDIGPGPGGDGGGAGDDGGHQNTEFTGSSIGVYITASGEQKQPDDFNQQPIVAFQPGSMAGATMYPAVPRPDGTFTIPNLPEGPAWIRQGTDRFIYTTARSIDLNHYHIGRLDRTQVMKETELTMNLTGLSPWGDEDEIQLVIANLGFLDTPLLYSAVEPSANATSVMGVSFDWRDVISPYLVDPAKGDLAILSQLSTKTTMGVTYLTLSRSASVPTFSIKDGMPASLTTTLGETAPQMSLPINWKRSRFEMLRTSVHPNAQTFAQSGTVYTTPGGPARAELNDMPDLLRVQPNVGDTDLALGTLTFRNPYPNTWTTYGRFQQQYRVAYTVPGATRTGSLLAAIGMSDTVARLATEDIAPVVGPVTNVTVNGMSALNNLNNVTTTPIIRWDPPALGTANGFIVNLYQLELVAGQQFPRSIRVATFYTTQSGFTVPAGLMGSGKLYCFTIRSLFQPGVDVTRAPYQVPVQRAYADTITAILTP